MHTGMHPHTHTSGRMHAHPHIHMHYTHVHHTHTHTHTHIIYTTHTCTCTTYTTDTHTTTHTQHTLLTSTTCFNATWPNRNKNSAVSKVLQLLLTAYSTPLSHQLVAAILQACPHQLHNFLKLLQPHLVPRPLDTWVTCLQFFLKVGLQSTLPFFLFPAPLSPDGYLGVRYDRFVVSMVMQVEENCERPCAVCLCVKRNGFMQIVATSSPVLTACSVCVIGLLLSTQCRQ